jgi:DNA-binding transcriptional MerR regulator
MDLNKKIEKLYFSIGEVSELVEIEAYTLRYWESEFKHIKPQKNNVGVRRYKKTDIEQILELKDLLHLKKFTIKGAREVLKNGLLESTNSDKSELNDRITRQENTILSYKSELKDIKQSLQTIISGL